MPTPNEYATNAPAGQAQQDIAGLAQKAGVSTEEALAESEGLI